MHPDNRCDKHLSLAETMMGNKEEPGKEIRAEELWSQHLFCQEFLSVVVQEEEDTGGGRCDSEGREGL